MNLGNLKQNDEKKENLLGCIYVTKWGLYQKVDAMFIYPFISIYTLMKNKPMIIIIHEKENG